VTVAVAASTVARQGGKGWSEAVTMGQTHTGDEPFSPRSSDLSGSMNRAIMAGSSRGLRDRANDVIEICGLVTVDPFEKRVIRREWRHCSATRGA
jgi:hypothetical protein